MCVCVCTCVCVCCSVHVCTLYMYDCVGVYRYLCVYIQSKLHLPVQFLAPSGTRRAMMLLFFANAVGTHCWGHCLLADTVLVMGSTVYLFLVLVKAKQVPLSNRPWTSHCYVGLHWVYFAGTSGEIWNSNYACTYTCYCLLRGTL